MSHQRRSMLKTFFTSAFLGLTLCLALAGCGATANATNRDAAPTATTTTMQVATATPQPSSPQPTPLPVGTFTTYTNTTYGYSISYPKNWSVEGAEPTAMSFIVFNYNPQTYQQPFSAPPLLKIEVDAAPNPSHLSPLDYFKQSATEPGQPAVTIQTTQATTLAGHNAEQIIWTSAGNQYPIITDLIAKGDTMLVITQTNAANGQPSPVFARMLASLTITG